MNNITPNITVEMLEAYLDLLAIRMVENGVKYDCCIPLYERLENEVEKLKNQRNVRTSILERTKGLRQRMETQSF